MRRRRPLEGGTLTPKFLEGNMVSRLQELERANRALKRQGLTTTAAEAAYGRRFILTGWGRENVAASLTGNRLARFGASDTWIRPQQMPRAGVVTGIGAALSTNCTAGTLTVELYLNGSTASVTAVIDTGTPIATWEVCAVDFEGGDYLDLYLTTTGSYTPTSADLMGMIEFAWE
jgi:hypothetical protein